jgi:hypothetical protein
VTKETQFAQSLKQTIQFFRDKDVRQKLIAKMNTTHIAVNGATAFLMIYLETKDRGNPKEL